MEPEPKLVPSVKSLVKGPGLPIFGAVANPPNVPPPQAIVIMGVAGSGKTTIGQALARTLGWPFRDADEFHPAANFAKMSAGVPLTDTDRAPWLVAIRAHLEAGLVAGTRGVVSCSALKQAYRDALIFDPVRIRLVHLHGPREIIAARLAARTGHFMPPSLLDSQLAALEEPRDALRVDLRRSPGEIVGDILVALGLA
jgi:gluconokinase